jgi:hypothetical protein
MAWSGCVAATALEFGGSMGPALAAREPGALLLLLRGRELQGRSTDPAALAADGLGPLEEWAEDLPDLARRGWVEPRLDGTWSVSRAGRGFLGELAETLAVRESAEHRLLLGAAFRIFARHGERLEIVRQGRFDTRLPDGRWRSLSAEDRQVPGEDLAGRIAQRRASWAWRRFGGRDVYVEAEVSGADRRERIVRDLHKASAAGAHCLFLVGDPRRARRLRAVLADRRVGHPDATVWVLTARHREEAEAPRAKSDGA